MCFRPAGAGPTGPNRCPICGKINRPTATECVKCGATEADIIAAMAEKIEAEGGGVAPMAPKVPGAAPKTPAAGPKAPGATSNRPAAPGGPKQPDSRA